MLNHSEHDLWLLDDNEGKFTGALIEMSTPISSNKQWQALLNRLLGELVKVEETVATVNGVYAISFSESHYDKYAGMLISKITGATFEEAMSVSNLPAHSLGMLYISDDEVYTKVATFSLIAGDYSDKGIFSPNRVLAATLINDTVTAVRKHNVSPDLYNSITSKGKQMLNHLDSQFTLFGRNN
jgi:hypothetical protein